MSYLFVVKVENMVEKLDWMVRIRVCIEVKGGFFEDFVRFLKDFFRFLKDFESNVIIRFIYDGFVSKLCGIKNCFFDLR